MNAHRELQVPGARLRYRDEGAGQAVVFVHGWTLDLDMWDPQASLAAGLRVVRYDRRGFGMSSGIPSLAEDVADLRALLAALGVVSPLLVGMSQGARVVLEFAARQPRGACGLVLDGPPPLPAAGHDGVDDVPLAQFRQLAARDGIAAFRRLWSAHPLTRLVTRDEDTHALLARMLERYPGHDLQAPAAPPPEAIEARLLAGLRVPALVVNGALDTAARRSAGAALQSMLAGAEHVLVPAAGHMPNLDAPRQYNQLMSGFARRLPVAA